MSGNVEANVRPNPDDVLVKIADYVLDKKDFLISQIGNPEGNDIPNKKFYDPRVWLREGEETFKARLIKAFKDLNNINTLD